MKIDNGDEWERASAEVGGYDADCDIDFIEEDRDKRRRKLIGKYLIICDSRHDASRIRYLQDQTISPSFAGHYWTNYLENAKGFVDVTAAYVKCRNLTLNNPRVVVVLKDYKLKEVDRFGHYRESEGRGKFYCSQSCHDKADSRTLRNKQIYCGT